MAYLYSANAGDRVLSGSSLSLKNGDASAPELRFYEDEDNGALYTGFKAGNVSATKVYTLPLTDGSSGQVLSTNGSAVLSWASSGGSPAADDISAGDAAVTIETSTGAVTIDSNAAAVTIDGHTGVTLQSTDSGNITLDSVADIVLDADGADILFKDGGTLIGGLVNSSSDLVVSSSVTNKDIVFKGSDGGSAVTAFTIDMSDAGTLIGNNDLSLNTDSSVIKMGDGADFTITHDGTTGATIAGNPVNITSAGAATWKTSAGALTVDAAAAALTLDGHTGVTVQSSNSGDITLDSVADIVLDADGGDIFLKDGGTQFGALKIGSEEFSLSGTIDGRALSIETPTNSDMYLYAQKNINLDANGGKLLFSDNDVRIGGLVNSSTHFHISSSVQDKDIVFVGNDGGSAVTALTIDMSEAGTLIGNNDLKLNTDSSVFSMGDGADFSITHDGNTGATIAAGATGLTLDVAGDISLDADGADILLKDGGTLFGGLVNSSTDFVISASVSDKDIIFKGSDGGSGITALTLDMSDAGRAVFNNDVRAGVDMEVLGDLIVGAGANEFSISESSDDITISSLISDKDMIFKVNDGGSSTEVFRLDGDVSALKVAGGNKLQFRDSALYIYSSEDGHLDIVADQGVKFTESAVDFGGAQYFTLAATTNNKGGGPAGAFVSGSYTVTDSDNVRILAISGSTSGASSVTITLPSGSNNAGRIISVKNVGGNASDNVITITGSGGLGEKIDGNESIKLDADYAAIDLIMLSGSKAGNAWYVF